jgi:hypothetical protein
VARCENDWRMDVVDHAHPKISNRRYSRRQHLSDSLRPHSGETSPYLWVQSVKPRYNRHVCSLAPFYQRL